MTPWAALCLEPGLRCPVPLPFFFLCLVLRFFLCLALGFFFCEGVVVVAGWLCEEVVCFLPGWDGCGAVCVEVVEVEVLEVVEAEVVVEVALDVDVELEDAELVALEVALLVVEVALLAVEVALLVVEVVVGSAVVLVVTGPHVIETM